MSASMNQVLGLLTCLGWIEDELRRSDPQAQDWVRATLEPARRAAGTAFEALRSAARRGDPKARVALDALVASLAINDAQKSRARARAAAPSVGTSLGEEEGADAPAARPRRPSTST